MLSDVGEDHLLLLDPIEATSADIRCRLAQLPIESGGQVVGASPAMAVYTLYYAVRFRHNAVRITLYTRAWSDL